MAHLNDEQRLAATTKSSHLLCLAGAGTGKTFSMLSRIAELIKGGADPTSMLVLTFTRAAAFDMKRRYIRSYPNQATPNFRTFHAFCYSLIMDDIQVRKRLGYYKIPSIVDSEAYKRIATTTRLECGIKLSSRKLSGKAKLTAKEEFELSVYRKALRKNLQTENVITFDILCYGVCKLFESNNPAVAKYKDQYKYIFVDEFQDTDPAQWRFVASFSEASLFVVGDALQAIYSFRGADSTIIKSLANDKDWDTVKLRKNYRSTSEICKFANDNSVYADKSYRIQIDSDRSGADVSVHLCAESYNDRLDRGAVDRDALEDVCRILPQCSGSSAVLLRTNAEVDTVYEFLRSQGMNVRTGHKAIESLHVLKAAIDDKYLVDWCSTFLDSQRYSEYLRVVRLTETADPAKLFYHKFKDHPSLSNRLMLILAVRNVLSDGSLTTSQKYDAVLDLMNVEHKPLDLNTRIRSLDLYLYLQKALKTAENSDIYVGTIHSSKGLEYDNVFLLGVEGPSFRLTGEENCNLYYVGITRAKNLLHVYKYGR